MVAKFRPDYAGEFPSLGWGVVDWIEENLAMPDRDEYEPLILTDEQVNFIVNLLRVDERTGRKLVYRRAVYSRPKGPIAHSEVVYTPDGWRRHGDLKVGDKVYAVDGTITTVVELGDEVYDDCYRVVFSDGTSVVCTGSHRFPVDVFTGNHERERKIVTVDEMLDSGIGEHNNRRYRTLPTPELRGAELDFARSRMRTITAIEPVDTVPARCITVAHPKHQYLVGSGLVPTCNSGKSPFMAALALAFAFADVIPDGYDSNGRPVGKPLGSKLTPHIQLAAVSEDQAKNAYLPALEMCRKGNIMDNYDVDPMDTFIGLPGGGGTGKIQAVTSSSVSREGGRPYLCLLDQTESWTPVNGGEKLAKVLRRNAAKVDGLTIETPNAFEAGLNSVAEVTANYYAELMERGISPIDEGLLYDHKEAPADTDLADRESLLKGLRYVYSGCPWVNVERIAAEARDRAVAPSEFRRYFLNQVSSAQDAWISKLDWDSCRDETLELEDGDRIVLGFDGSRGRLRGKADATALIAMRLSDKFITPIRIWEQPDHVDEWEPDVFDVDATVRDTFNRYQVVGMFADPSGWTEQVARWEAQYGRRLRIKAKQNKPIAVWPRGKGAAISLHVEQFRQAIAHNEIKHNGSPGLTRHMLNARRRAKARQGYLLYKEHPDSANKIDAAYAAVMAYMCATNAISDGLDRGKRKSRGQLRVFR